MRIIGLNTEIIMKFSHNVHTNYSITVQITKYIKVIYLFTYYTTVLLCTLFKNPLKVN